MQGNDDDNNDRHNTYGNYMGEQNPAFADDQNMPELPSGKNVARKDTTIALWKKSKTS